MIEVLPLLSFILELKDVKPILGLVMVGLNPALLVKQLREIVIITIILGQKDQIQFITSIFSVIKSLMLA